MACKIDSVFGFEGTRILQMAQWLSWLERRPVTAKVVGSSPIWVVVWGLSSAGRASALQAEGHRFEPYRPHYSAECIYSVPMWLNWQSS